MPKVSILVPIYNVEKYLRECLESLSNQTLQDIEIICINDGSTDNSLGIIKEYVKKRANVFVSSNLYKRKSCELTTQYILCTIY